MLYLGQPMLFECSLEFVFALKGALAKLPRNSFWTRDVMPRCTFGFSGADSFSLTVSGRLLATASF